MIVVNMIIRMNSLKLTKNLKKFNYIRNNVDHKNKKHVIFYLKTNNKKGGFTTKHRSAHTTSQVMKYLLKRGKGKKSFKLSDLKKEISIKVSDKTLTRILKQLEKEGWVERNRKNGKIWRRGEISEEILQTRL